MPPFVRDNLRLYYARWLAQYGLYDEVLDAFDGLTPAMSSIRRRCCSIAWSPTISWCSPTKPARRWSQLMEHEEPLPRRFQQVAQLVERDLSGLEDESLDHIARRMNDIRRRLAYGRAGEQVQTDRARRPRFARQEQSRKSKSSNSKATAGAGRRPTAAVEADAGQPAPEMKAPMQVDQRDIGHESGWGDLPPKEREQALQQIGREFPAHYRDLIEQYFRELANESNPPAN